MSKLILTGAPGAGKTSLLLALESRGFAVVREAATDVIALDQARGVDEPWLDARFIDQIVRLQVRRENGSTAVGRVLFDRSPVCTLALARYLGFQPPSALQDELDRILKGDIYCRKVLLIEPIGFITHTDARRITYDESLRFGQLHIEAYREFGFELLSVPPNPIDDRVKTIQAMIEAL